MRKLSRLEIWGAIFIVLAIFVADPPALRAGFIWDDDAYVTNDPWQYLWAIGCLGVAASLWLTRHALGRGPIVAIVFFVAVLSPMLGFIPLFTFYYTFVADHYQYLACLGLIALFAGTATYFSQLWRVDPLVRYAPAFFLLLVLAALTWRQAGAYQNLETLWRDTLAKNPTSWMAHTNLGWLLTAQGKLAEAESQYQAALRLKSDAENVHYDYGNMLVKAGRLDEAITQYRQTLRLNPTDPQACNHLGVVLHKEHRTNKAIACFHKTLRYQPDFSDAHFNLGNALFVEHKYVQAIEEYREALRLKPDSAAIKSRLRTLGAPVN